MNCYWFLWMICYLRRKCPCGDTCYHGLANLNIQYQYDGLESLAGIEPATFPTAGMLYH